MNFKKLLFSFLLLTLTTVGWGQVNIIPVRTDVSGFATWTDTDIAGTTYLQLLKVTSVTITPAMDFNSYTNETLDFKARTYGGTNTTENTITVWISTDNGSTWTSLGTRIPATNTPTAQTQFDISAYSGTQVKIKFTVSGTSDTIGAGIDDITIKGILSSTPTVTTSTGSLTGFNYVEGSGPSAEQSFTVSGTNLTADISVTPPTNWEISTTSGGPYQTTAITLTQSGGSVISTTIYTRMVSGLLNADSPFSGNIACESGATTQNVAVDGTVTTTGSFCATDLIISEYVEGSSNNKYIELYNGTSATIDLSNYQLLLFVNGGSSASNTVTLSGNLISGSTIVYKNSSATIYTGSSINNTAVNFNGDDAIALYKISTASYVDVFGQIGYDPGTYWGTPTNNTLDHTLVRKSSISNGDTNGSDTFDPSIQWDFYAIDDVSNLGSHTMDCTPCSEPTTDAAFWANSPQNITGTSVDLHWTNGDGTNRIVVLHQGSPVTFVPVDSNTYSANTDFSAGTVLADGSKVVYNGSSNTVSVTGLTPGTIYYTTIYEYGCTAGNEDYYTSGTPTTDIFVTTPENPATFSYVCISDNGISLGWTPPATGTFQGYLLTVRQGATPSAVNSIDPSSITTANTDLTVAGTYGTSSYYLYKGTGTSATITGLTTGLDYTFKLYAYTDAGTVYEYSSGTTTTQTIELSNVTSAYASAGDTQATAVWTNPSSGCYDAILVVVNETSGMDFTPSGDGSAYIPNTVYGGVNSIVYNSSSNTVTVTGLTNGTTYYFEIFVRNGTEWSSGVEVSVTPNTQTTFLPGDLVIVAYDNQAANSVDDIVTILTMVDIQPNTTFWYANATYEVGAAAYVRTEQWKSCNTSSNASIGAQQFTYIGPDTLPAGSTFCITIDNSQITSGDFSVHQSSGSGTYTFSDGYIPAGFATSVNISISDPDSVFLMQGDWSGDLGGYRTFDGKVLGGIQDGGSWYDISDDLTGLSGAAALRRSRIPPDIECFAVQGTNSPSSGYAYYNDIRTGSQITLLSNIIDFSGSWVVAAGTTSDDVSGFSCISGFTFSISGSATAGIWTDAANDQNWFNCRNWENFQVPDETVDVTINNLGGSHQAKIEHDAINADIYSGIAKCNNLTINAEKVTPETTGDILEIYGNLSIGAAGTLDMSDDNNTSDDGVLYLYGNWTNADVNNFDEGNSTVHFVGSVAQTVTCNGGVEHFYNVVLNNPTGFTTDSFNSDLYAAGSLTMTQGNLTVKSGHYALAGKDLSIGTGTTLTVENEGSLVQTDDSGIVTNNGTTIVHRTTSPYIQYDYTYFSSPIVNETVTDALSPFSPLYYLDAGNYLDEHNSTSNSTTTTGFPQLYGTPDGFDDAAPYDWQTATGFMTPGVGYIGRGNVARPSGQAVTFTATGADGRLNNGVINVTVEKDAYTVTGGSTAAELLSNNNANLIGNPYPSALSLAELYHDNHDADIPLNSLLTGTFYFWTHSTAPSTGITGPWLYNYDANDFATYNATGIPFETAASVNGGATPTGYVASGQGFIALINEDYGSATGTLQFNNSQRGVPTATTYTNNQFFRQASVNSDRIWLNLQTPDNESRVIAIGFENGASNTYDAYDSPRMENGHANDFYSLITPTDAFKLAIQRLEPFTEDKIIPLGMELNSSGTCQIMIDHAEGIFSEGQRVYLEDKSLNIIHDLSLGAYTFTQTSGDNINNRFVLRFNTNALATDEHLLQNLTLYPNPSKGVFYINYTGTETLEIEVFDVLGKQVLKRTNTNTGIFNKLCQG